MSNPFAPPGTVDEAKPADVYVSTSWYSDVRETARLWIEAWPVLLAWAPIMAVVVFGAHALSHVSVPLTLLYDGTVEAMAMFGASISAVLWHHRRLSGAEGVWVAVREGAARAPWTCVVWIVPGLMVNVGLLLLVAPGIWMAARYGLLTVVVACEDGGAELAVHRAQHRLGRIAALGAFLTLLTLTATVVVQAAMFVVVGRAVAAIPAGVVLAALETSVTLAMYVVWREAYRDQNVRGIS